MAGEKYEKYGRPEAPANLDAEYMTIQETAYVLKCSVSHARRLVNETGLCSRMGRRIVTSRADRTGLYEANHAGGRVPRRASRRPARRTLTQVAA